MKKSNLQRGYRTPDNKTLKTTYKISSKVVPGSSTTVTHTAFGVPFALNKDKQVHFQEQKLVNPQLEER